MTKKFIYPVSIVLVLGVALAGVAQGAALAPDDSSIKDNLCLWLRNPGVNFDEAAGIWTDASGKGNDAEAMGEIDVWGVTYAAPILSFGSNPDVFGGEFSTVKFSGDVDDLMQATNINGGAGLSALTVIAVYKLYNQDQSGTGMTRPLGIGSFIGEGANLGDYFNLANDVSIRKDNGSVGGATATHPDDTFFIRVARMNADSIDQWFNTDGTLAQIHNSSGNSYTTSVDNFYLGDLRADSTTNGGGTSGYSTSDIEIAEVIVYNTDLTANQIEGISEWLQANVGSGGGPPLASRPNPAEGAMLEATWSNLSWRPGYYAVSHDVYIGENFDDVNDGAEGTFLGNQAVTTLIVGFPGFPFPDGLVPSTTYYWRIDEVNDTDPNSPWKGKVWSFFIPPRTAYDPIPSDGVKFVKPDVELNWMAGFNAKLHYVYLGDNFDDVNNAVVGLPQSETTYTPGTLELDKVYYWRVDEFDGADTLKGDVWSFKTVPDVEVTNPNFTLWWTLDEGEGATAVDWSGHGNHGAINGQTQWVDGYQGTTLTFADNVYVEAAGYPGITGTAARTCCAWIKTTTANRNIMSWGNNVAGQKWRVRLQNTGGLRVEVNGGSHYGVTNLADGRWHHVAVVLEDDGSPDAVETLLYVDGQLDATAASADEPINTAAGAVRIGESPWHNAPFVGEIDDVRIYDKALTQEEIQLAMRGDTSLAWGPSPSQGSTLYIRDATPLNWSPGDIVSQHDVYFGTDRGAVADADTSDTTGIYRGRQGVTIYTPSEGVEWGGGPYYWRVDEYNTDATISKGNVWSFTVTDFIGIDDIEDYNDYPPDEIFSTWIDGWEVPTNGSLAGHPDPPFAETTIVHGSSQSMPFYYENNFKYSEATMTLVSARDWTEEGVGVLSLWFYGDAANAAERMYVNLNGIATVYHDNPSAALINTWTEWRIDLQKFAAQGVNLANVNTITIGFGDKNNLQAGGSGLVFFDDIRLYRPAQEPEPAP